MMNTCKSHGLIFLRKHIRRIIMSVEATFSSKLHWVIIWRCNLMCFAIYYAIIFLITKYLQYIKADYNSSAWYVTILSLLFASPKDNNLYYQLASLLPFRWCAVNNIEVALVSGSNITTAMQDSRLCLQNVYGTESWW